MKIEIKTFLETGIFFPGLFTVSDSMFVWHEIKQEYNRSDGRCINDLGSNYCRDV